ncbi:phage tail length tape measure family protein [Massilia sp. CFBP9026]|uniref:phage tail length tape measure family protein n=1 Tax=Massilia sp. CFBP9026 TaxID=3096536 RepID=UPI002A69E7C7|nr:phage tail length tape measure family protein [Massilia sp. CFBP9026]MDY0961733.1 phage tail length tape measure family protein [Massilia sp. CFBP9026]
MTDIVNNATIMVTADSSGVEAGLRPAVDAANRTGQAIAQTGQKAASASRAVETAQRNIIASIQRTTMAMEAGGRTTAAYYEAQARQRNVDPASLTPYLNQLRAVEAAQTQATESTRAEAAAARELAQVQSNKESFLAGLREQIALFGKSADEVQRYRAAQAGAADAADPLIAQLRALRVAQEQAAEAARLEALAQREAAQAKANRESFVAGLREQIALHGKSADEVLRYRAAQAGASQESSMLILQLQNMRVAQEQVEAAARAAALAQREAAQADAARNTFLAGLREQIALFGLSTDEVNRYRAAQLGASTAADPLIAKLRDLRLAQEQQTYATRMEAQAQRELAQAQASRTSFLKGLEQQVAAIGKTRTEMLELQAAQLGVTTQAKPLLDQLRAQDQAFRNGGMSAAAMNAALRGVPAQLTDIVVSLQGGQAPLTVFLQQGGQLRDMFGSAGLAARALGSAALGLINPFTVTVGVLATGAIAFKSGHDEAVRYSRALIMTGNIAGTTAGQMADMANRMEEINGSQGVSSKALATLASTGAIAGVNLEKFGTVAVDAQRVLGKSVEDTAKEFAALGKDPLTALRAMGDQYGFITTETYLAVKAAQDQGRMIEAASIAQNAYADGVANQKTKVLETLGSWEKGWLGIKRAASGAWSSTVDFFGGREMGPQEKISAFEAQIAKQEERITSLKAAGVAREGEKYDPTKDRDVQGAEAIIAANKREIESVQQVAEADKKAAEQKGKKTQAQELERKYLKDQEILFTRKELMQRELRATETEAREKGVNEEILQNQLLAIRRKYNDVFVAGIDAGMTALRKRGELEDVLSQRALANIKAQRDAGAISEDAAIRQTADEELAMIDRRKRGLQEQLGMTRQKIGSERDQLDLQGQIATLNEQRVSREKQLEDDLASAQRVRSQASMDLYMQGVTAANAEADSLADQLKAQQLANEEIGLSKSALADLQFERMNATAALKDQTAAEIDALDPGSALAEAYRRQAEQLRGLAQARREGAIQQDSYETSKKALDELNQFLDPARAQTFGDALREAFGGAGESISKMTASLEGFAQRQAEIAKNRATAEAQRGTKDFDEIKYQKTIAELNERETRNRLAGYGAMTGAAAGFFGEQSRGYKALQTASQVFHAAELAMTLAELVPKGISAVLSQGSGDPYTAFGRMAAMAAIVAGLGVAIGGVSGGGVPLSQQRQEKQGTGTVLGSDAKSESIARSLEAIEGATLQGLGISNGMLTSLRNIEAGIGQFASLLVRTTGVTGDFRSELTGSKFDTKGLNSAGMLAGGALGGLGGGAVAGAMTMGVTGTTALTTLGAVAGPIGMAIGAVLGALLGKSLGRVMGTVFGGKKFVEDTGFTLNPASYGDIQAGGADAAQYAEIKTTGGWFGKDKFKTELEGLGAEGNRQITSVLMSLYDTVFEAGQMLDIGADGFAAQLSSFVVDIGKVSLKGLSDDEIQKELSAVFSKVGDDLAKFGVGGLEQFQKVGEGYLETLTRVATNYQAVAVVTDSLGMTFDSLGLASVGARERLIDLVGGLDEFTSSADQFLSDFYTDRERADALRARIAPTLGQFGIKTGAEDSLQQFRSVVTGLDLTTEAGARAYATLIQIAPAFKSIADVDAKIFEERADLQKELDQLTLTETQLLAQQRAALDESNRALFDQVQAVKAQANAAQMAKDAASSLLGGVDAAFSVLQKVVGRQKQALQEEITVRNASIQSIEALSQSLRSTLDGMTVQGREAEDRLAAQAQIQAALAIAKASGTLPKAEDLRNALSVVSKDSSALFATQEDYLRDFYATRIGIEDLAGLTDNALSVEERSLKQLEDQVARYDLMLEREQEQIDVLKGLSITGLSIEQAILALRGAMQAASANPVVSATSAISDAYKSALGRAPDADGLKYWQDRAAGGISTGAIVDSIKNSPEAQIKALYKDVFGRTADAAGLSYWMDRLKGGISLGAIKDTFESSDEAKKKLRGFAVGTNYIPVDMPAMVHQGERIIPAADNRELMRRLASPEQGNEVLATELRALREENRQLRKDLNDGLYAIAKHTMNTASSLDDAINGEKPLATKIIQEEVVQ